MNRKEEYRTLLNSIEYAPELLDTTVERALKRKSALRKKQRVLGIPTAGFAACFLGFVLLVNVFPPFAKACESIPLLKELAEAVTWSPSLTAAVENEYVQPIGKSQTVNGITATIEYLIVDQKQVNIFFTLDGDYENLSGSLPKFQPEQRCSTVSGNFLQPPGTLLHYTLDYGEEDVPNAFNMTFNATTYVEPEFDEQPEPSADVWEDMFHPAEDTGDVFLVEFSFDLSFDPNFTATGERIPVDAEFELDGQHLTVTKVEVYPSHVRVEIEGAAENTAWLKGVTFYMENEAGERFEPISNGISASGDPNSPAMLSFRLESPYFAHSQHLTLHITQAEWLDKDLERIGVDLQDGVMDREMEGVELLEAEKRSDGWLLTFKVKRLRENHSFAPFSHRFYDAAGVEYENHSNASSWIDEEHFEAIIPLPDYPYDEVWLEPYFSHRTECDPEIIIPVK